MNITPHIPTLPVGTAVNPQTDSLRRENSIRQVIAQPEAISKGAAEKSVASDRERARTPNQTGESFDFSELQRKAEESRTVISGDKGDPQGQGNSEQSADQETAQQNVEQEQPEINAQEDDVTAQTRIEEFEQQRQIDKLEQRDREVKSHELAHASVGGAATGAPRYSYQVGPDGKKYAVGGEVSVDLSIVKDNPRATIAKMQRVHAAALAPANPSAQDNRVAAAATRLIIEAQSQLAEQGLSAEKSTSNKSSYTRQVDVFQQFQGSEDDASNEFDQRIEQTLRAQETIAPSRTKDVADRAVRVQGFYLSITQAYEKPSSSNFQLTA